MSEHVRMVNSYSIDEWGNELTPYNLYNIVLWLTQTNIVSTKYQLSGVFEVYI